MCKIYDYSITLIKRKKFLISFLRIVMALYLHKLPFSQICFMLSLVQIGPVILRRFRQCFFAISLLSPFEIEHGPTCERTNLNPHHWKEALCLAWLKLAQWFWRRIFLNFVNAFSLYRYYLPLETEWPFIWTNYNPLHPRMICAKLDWNWTWASGEFFFYFVNVYSLFCIYL